MRKVFGPFEWLSILLHQHLFRTSTNLRPTPQVSQTPDLRGLRGSGGIVSSQHHCGVSNPLPSQLTTCILDSRTVMLLV